MDLIPRQPMKMLNTVVRVCAIGEKYGCSVDKLVSSDGKCGVNCRQNGEQ